MLSGVLFVGGPLHGTEVSVRAPQGGTSPATSYVDIVTGHTYNLVRNRHALAAPDGSIVARYEIDIYLTTEAAGAPAELVGQATMAAIVKWFYQTHGRPEVGPSNGHAAPVVAPEWYGVRCESCGVLPGSPYETLLDRTRAARAHLDEHPGHPLVWSNGQDPATDVSNVDTEER